MTTSTSQSVPQSLIEELGLSSEHLGRVLVHLAVALCLGGLLAHRPWRRWLEMRRPAPEMVHAQILICVAGAIAVTVIGDSLARAFGLVGLGGFIRFRTGIRDPRDAAVFFVLIGLGMACGLGALGTAIACTAFAAFVMSMLDLLARRRESPYVRLTAACADPAAVERVARPLLLAMPLTILSTRLRLEAQELSFELENPEGVVPAEIMSVLLSGTGGAIRALECERLETLKGASVS